MKDFLVILDAFVKHVIHGKRQLDEEFLASLVRLGVDETQIESALTILYNLVVNRKLLAQKSDQRCFRYITEEEERELGFDILAKLHKLQVHKMINPADMDYLIYGYLENRGLYQDEEEFMKILKSHCPDAWEYLEISEHASGKVSQNLH